MSTLGDMLKDIKIPKMAKVRQVFPRERIENIPVAVRKELEKGEISVTIQPGMQIAITAGSRGVANIAVILREIVSFVLDKGACPFIIPAMGSHGEGIAEEQANILESYGITEEFCGCPIKATMRTKQIGVTEEQQPVFIDKYASEADGIIVVNRIKPHTGFCGPYESGLMKMMTIGLGKQIGADICHEAGFKNMAKMIPMIANVILKKANILFGVALLENPYDETRKVVALAKDDISKEEPSLLIEAKSMIPRILFEETDVLIVDKIGKNYSGDGMDPHVTGSFATPYASGGIKAQKIVALDLSEETHGNGQGMGLADFCTRRLFNKADLELGYVTAMTATVVTGVKIPIILNSDKEAIQAAIKTCNSIDKNRPAIIRISNTLHVEYIYISEALFEKAKEMANIEIIEEPRIVVFDRIGNLQDL